MFTGFLRRTLRHEFSLPSTKLRLHNITSRAALKYGRKVWVLNKKECHHLEEAKMKFLRSLLGLTRLDHQRNTTILERLKVEHKVDEMQVIKRIGYNMLKGWNPPAYPGWHWHTNQTTNATKADQK
jgi:hypothetical protein